MDRVERTVGGYNRKKTTENVEAIGEAKFIFGHYPSKKPQRTLLKIYEEESKIH